MGYISLEKNLIPMLLAKTTHNDSFSVGGGVFLV